MREEPDGIVRIVYENLCRDEDKPFEHGFAMIQKAKCRANDIHILMDKFEMLGCMPVYQKMVGIDLCETDYKALHLRRKMETIMLGLEIWICPPRPSSGGIPLLSMEDFPVYTLLKFLMAAIVTQAIKILQVILHCTNQLTEKKSGEGPESVQTTRTICPEAKTLDYLMQGWLWYGAGYVNTVLKTAPYSDADSLQTALSHDAPLPYHGYPVLEKAYRPGFDYSRVQERKAKFLLTALLGNMQEWMEMVPDQSAWDLLMKELGWIVSSG
jgi:hypothetical protein